MGKRSKVFLFIAAAVGVVAVGSAVYANTGKMGQEKVKTDFTVNYKGVKTADFSAGVSVHDPSILKADGSYYIFGSHMSAATSNNLKNWKSIGDGYSPNNPIFNQLLDNKDAFAYAGSKTSIIPTDDGTTHVWAPDIIYNKAQKMYYMYFCTSSTWNASNLCYAVSKTAKGPYTWKGALIYSGFTEKTINSTDVLKYVTKDYAKNNYMTPAQAYNFDKYPNAIDPTVFYDQDGKMWMVYGSWSGGIFLLELDAKTGLVKHPKADPSKNVDAYFGKRLLGGGHKSIEAPYILYDKNSGYYYLFVSYGSLTREGGYQIRVFRSKTVNGDYVDMNGAYPSFCEHSNFGLKLSGNYYLPSLSRAYMATGHNSAFIDDDGKRYIVYHTRFDNGQENHEPRVHQFLINQQGWPCMLPYATDGETVSSSGYNKKQIVGEYYVTNQGTEINAKIATPEKWVLTDRGVIQGKNMNGTWKDKNGTCYIQINYNGIAYQGVLCEMKDEAGTRVMTFSAVGNNQSIWGVKY